MSGLLSNIFDGGDAPGATFGTPTLGAGADGGETSPQGSDDAEGAQQGGSPSGSGPSGDAQSDTLTTGAHGGGDIGLGAHLDLGMSGSYENADGSTTQWQHDDTVNADTSVDAAFAATMGLTEATVGDG